MREKLFNAFPSIAERELSDEYIKEHYDLMWDIPKIPLIRAVPLYMLWCINHATEEGELVFDNTISALNNYSREKNEREGFKFLCNGEQIAVISEFLQWCKTNLILDYEPSLSRAIKNWKALNKSNHLDAQKARDSV